MANSLRTTLHIRQRLEWITFSILTIAVATLSVVSLNFDVKHTIATEYARLETASKILAADTALTLQAIDRTLGSVIRNHPDPFNTGNQTIILRNLQTISEAIPGVRAINVIDLNATVVAGYPLNLMGRSFSERYFYTEPKAKPDIETLYVSPPYQSILNDNVVSVTRMIGDRNKKFAGAVSVILDPVYFGERIKSVVFAADVKTWIVGSKKNVFVKASTASYDESLHVLPLSALFLFRPLEPIIVQRAVKPAGKNGEHILFIGISRDPNAVVAPLMREANLFTLFFLAVIFFSGVLLFFFQIRRRRVLEEKRHTQLIKTQADSLRLSEARFRALIEEAPVAIAILRRGRFLYSNLRYNTLHGYINNDELTGLYWDTLITPHSLNGLEMEVNVIKSDSTAELRFEAQSVGRSGEVISILTSTARIELHHGGVTLIFVQDISAQKSAERLVLEARDAAQAANRSKAEFLANMSHEIRTPLNAILGFTYLLEQSGLGHDADSTLNKIRNAGRSLLGIINDVLDMSKIDAGAMTIENASLNLHEVIDNVAAIMGGAAGDKPVQLLVHPLPPGVHNITGDALRLEQLLVNLTNNAIKFTLQGQVELAVSLEQFTEGEVLLRFSVADSGIGIPEEIQKTIFTPFTQADSSTTRRFGGSGLGLAICKKMVELMGGEIGLISTPNIGSTFWFTLPLKKLDNDLSCYNIVSLDTIMSSSHKGLLANLKATGHALGWNVSTANSPQAALMELIKFTNIENKIDSAFPKVVFLEWDENGDDCLTVARAIREILPITGCSVVGIISAATKSLGRKEVDSLIDAFVVKPVTVSTLNHAAAAALRKRAGVGMDSLAPVPVGRELVGVHILVVDDSDINRDVAQRILQGRGAKVYLAEDGQAAITWLLAHPDTVDIVLMDLQMPILDGIEATRMLRKMPQFSNLPIVALTAGVFKAQQEEACKVGMTDFVTKPFDISLIIGLIHRLTDRVGVNTDNRDVAAASDLIPHQLMILDTQRGIEIWGDIETYQLYLYKFAQTFTSSVTEIKNHINVGDLASAASTAHKLAGAAANVALAHVAHWALNLERYLVGNDVPSHDQTIIIDNLHLALEETLTEITKINASSTPILAIPIGHTMHKTET